MCAKLWNFCITFVPDTFVTLGSVWHFCADGLAMKKWQSLVGRIRAKSNVDFKPSFTVFFLLVSTDGSDGGSLLPHDSGP